MGTVFLVSALGGGRGAQVVFAVLAFLGLLLVIFYDEQIGFAQGLEVSAALIVLASALVGGLVYFGSIEPEPPRGCVVSEGDNAATVSAESASIYPEADHASTPTGLLLEGCTVEFDEYCIGSVVTDAKFEEVRDSRWLKLSEDELIASADTVGEIPIEQGPSTCSGGRKPPSKLTFRGVTLSPDGLIEVDATAPRAAVIGFALRQDDGTWLRLGWDHSPDNKEPETLIAPPEADPGDEVFARPCMAFERPIGPWASQEVKKGPVPGGAKRFIQPENKKPAMAACDAGAAEE